MSSSGSPSTRCGRRTTGRLSTTRRGKVASYVNDLRDQTERLWDALHFSFLPIGVSIPIYAALLYSTAASNALFYGLFLLVAGVVLVVLARPLRSRRRHLTDTTATNNGRVFDSYANFVNVFSFRSHRKEMVRNDAQIDGLIGDSIRYNYALSGYWGVAAALVRVGLWATVMGYSWYLFDSGRIGFTAMVVSITVLLDFTNQYWEVVYHYGSWVDNAAAYREAYNYLFPGVDIVERHYQGGAGRSVRSEPTDSERPSSRTVRLTESLEVRDLSFAYPDEPDRLILDNVSFRVAKGERLGVVGAQRRGQVDAHQAPARLLPADQRRGACRRGAPVDAETLNRLQTYVPQDTSLFQETIGYNIAYARHGEPGAGEISEAADKANIAGFVESLPERYETLVGERGIKLSLGQRQRIAIARAFLKPADLLILDEATSSLDSETETFVQEALENLWVDRAVIIIAHRLATLNNVDRIIVIDGGRVVEEGTKDELLAAGGAFAGLWDLQRAGLR